MHAGLRGVTAYIQCLATKLSSQQCKPPIAMQQNLEVLMRQNVQPIAVWAKCKSNYLLQSWDTASGALFMDNVVSDSISSEVYKHRAEAKRWAAETISPAFLNCMSSTSRFKLDYGVCMTMFLNLTTGGRLPNAYFLFSPQGAGSQEPPDACMVFSGLNASAGQGSPLQQTMQSCMMDTADGDPSLCSYNPSIWSAASPANVPVAKLFGTTTIAPSTATPYAALKKKMNAAFEAFNASTNSMKKLQVELFSADGDFIHDFFDCVFLGPYTRADILPCDKAGLLECPFYARDEQGGKSRDFTACYGPVMHGDLNLPFTCGSQARRAIIKYFFRDYVLQNLDSQVAGLLMARVKELWLNLTNSESYKCLDTTTGRCTAQACTKANSYAPCIDMEFTVSSSTVSQFLLKDILLHLDTYYAFIMQVRPSPFILVTTDNDFFKPSRNPPVTLPLLQKRASYTSFIPFLIRNQRFYYGRHGRVGRVLKSLGFFPGEKVHFRSAFLF